MKTRKTLIDEGAIIPANASDVWELQLGDETWIPKPSDNGNGWYLGDFESDNLLYVMFHVEQ